MVAVAVQPLCSSCPGIISGWLTLSYQSLVLLLSSGHSSGAVHLRLIVTICYLPWTALCAVNIYIHKCVLTNAVHTLSLYWVIYSACCLRLSCLELLVCWREVRVAKEGQSFKGPLFTAEQTSRGYQLYLHLCTDRVAVGVALSVYTRP